MNNQPIQNPLPSGVAVQVRLPVPYLIIKPRLKSGLCYIWRIESVAFVVAAGTPVQSVSSYCAIPKYYRFRS